MTVTMCHPGSVMASELNRESDGVWGWVARNIAPIVSHSLACGAACEVRAALDPTLANGDMIGPTAAYLGRPTCHKPITNESAINSIFKEAERSKAKQAQLRKELDKMWQVSEEMVGRKFVV